MHDSKNYKLDSKVRYLAYDAFNLDTSLPKVTFNDISPSDIFDTYCIISWVAPSDFKTFPDKYLGFVLTRNIDHTPTSPTDGAIVYSGRKSQLGTYLNVGDYFISGKEVSAINSEVLYTDLGLTPETTYYYALFLTSVKSSNGIFTYAYSTPSNTKITTLPSTGLSGLLGELGDFSNLDGWTISSSGNAKTVKVPAQNSEISFENVLQLSPQKATEGKDGPSTTATTTITLNQTSLKPNQLYTITYFARSTNEVYVPSITVNGTTDVNMNAALQGEQNIRGVTPLSASTCSFSENTCIMQAAYFDGDIDWFDTPSQESKIWNGIWNAKGLSFITGDTSDSSILTLYSTDGTTMATVQKGSTDGDSFYLSIVLSVNGEPLSSSTPVDGQYVQFANLRLFSGPSPYNYSMMNSTGVNNMIKNPCFNSGALHWSIAGNVTFIAPGPGATLTTSCDKGATIAQTLDQYTLIEGSSSDAREYFAYAYIKFNPQTDPKNCHCDSSSTACDLTKQIATFKIMDSTGQNQITSYQISADTYKNSSQDKDGFMTIFWLFSLEANVPNPQFIISIDSGALSSNNTDWSITVKNIGLPANTISSNLNTPTNLWPIPAPIIPNATFNEDTFDLTYSIDWDSNMIDSGKSTLYNLYYNTTSTHQMPLKNNYGLLCEAREGSSPDNLAFVKSFTAADGSTVNTPALEITAYGSKHSDISKQNTSATISTASFMGSGYYTFNIQFGEITGLDSNTTPTGVRFFSNLFHNQSYDPLTATGIQEGGESQYISMISFSTPAACQEESKDVSFTRASFSALGGQLQQGSLSPFSNNFTTPNGINLADGKNHALGIIWNTGYDFYFFDQTPSSTREPGYIRFLIDSAEYSCGWMGNDYGSDSIPLKAMRWFLGIEFDGSETNFDTIKLYINSMSYRPICYDDSDPKQNYKILNTPPTPNANTSSPPNRDTYIPDASIFMHYDPDQ